MRRGQSKPKAAKRFFCKRCGAEYERVVYEGKTSTWCSDLCRRLDRSATPSKKRSNLSARLSPYKFMTLKNRVAAKTNGHCAYCGSQLKEQFHVDHAIPIARGGTDDFENLQPACTSCNWKKGKSTAVEYLKELREEESDERDRFLAMLSRRESRQRLRDSFWEDAA